MVTDSVDHHRHPTEQVEVGMDLKVRMYRPAGAHIKSEQHSNDEVGNSAFNKVDCNTAHTINPFLLSIKIYLAGLKASIGSSVL